MKNNKFNLEFIHNLLAIQKQEDMRIFNLTQQQIELMREYQEVTINDYANKFFIAQDYGFTSFAFRIEEINGCILYSFNPETKEEYQPF